MYEIKQTLIRVSEDVGVRIRTPKDIQRFLLERGLPTVETMNALYLNAKHELQAVHLVSVGTLNGTLVHPREVFGAALRMGTVAAIILAHNHPSGDITPSQEDVAVTQRIKECGEILGLPLVDHIIWSDRYYYSFKEEGKL